MTILGLFEEERGNSILQKNESIVATTIEITTTIEIIISIVVENAFQTKHHIATSIEITSTIEIIIYFNSG